MENKLERGKDWLESLLFLMGFPAQVLLEGFETIDADRESWWLNIATENLSPTQLQLLIGDKGKNIDAIQYLANTLLNLFQDPENQHSYTVELNGYRVDRYKELLEIVDQASAQVRETKSETAITDLSSAERKQIHSLLQNSPDLVTESRGQEPDRKLIVKLR